MSPAAPEQINEHVSGPFVQFFVKTVGHYASYIRWEGSGQGRFQERAFYKALPSKANRRFVKKFVKTQLFSLFIQEAEKSKNPPAGRQPAPLPPRPAGSLPWPWVEGRKGRFPPEAPGQLGSHQLVGKKIHSLRKCPRAGTLQKSLCS